MNNLFICNTQANLLLACGLALCRFKHDENDLILFIDFEISKDLKKRLTATFSRVLFLQSIYPSEFNTLKAKLKWYPKDWRLIKQFIKGKKYDEILAVCDWLFLVQKTLKKAHSINPAVKMAWLEDGITSYYSDSDIRKGLDANPLSFLIRKFIFRTILGLGKFYDRDFIDTGGLKCLEKIYTCYPEAVREPYFSNKKLTEITEEEYQTGLHAMYPTADIDITLPAVILVVDKLDRYLYPDKIQQAIKAYIHKCHQDGYNVICKFHPRENEFWDIFSGCGQLDRSIGIESTYASLMSKKDSITIAGIKSAGLMSAKKLGYNTISLFPASGESNDNLISFYKRLNIKLI